MVSNECGYCLEQADNFINPIVMNPCGHNMCNECQVFVAKNNKNLCPIDGKEQPKSKFNPNGRCKEHGKPIIGNCNDHSKCFCPACMAIHKDCKNKINGKYDDLSNKLNAECQKLSSPWTEHRVINENFSLITSGLETTEREIELYEFYKRELTQAKKSKSSERKEKTLQMSEVINDKSLSLIKKHSELYEKITRKPVNPVAPAPAPAVNYVGNQNENPDESDQNFPEDPSGGREEEGGGIQASKPIIELYQKLGNSVLRLFYTQKIYEKEEDNISFFISQDLVDCITITGFGIGTSIVSEFIEIIYFELSTEKGKVQLENEIVFKEENDSFCQEVKLNEPFMLDRNESCFVNIYLQGFGINYFATPMPGPVIIISPDNEPLMNGCPILYFTLQDPIKIASG